MLELDHGQKIMNDLWEATLSKVELPESLRPKGWRITLEEARSDMPASFASDETAAADYLLAG